MKYTVYVQAVVSATVEVDADSPQAAIDAAYESNDMPGAMAHGAFGSVSVDCGDWEVFEVSEETGKVVWAQPWGAQRPVDEETPA